MEHYRLRKYRGPETWARARAAYIAGESGPSVARRFDVGLANLRKKARLEGWTRARWAAQHDLKPLRGEADEPAAATGLPAGFSLDDLLPGVPADPKLAVHAGLQRAALALMAGRGSEALALMRACQVLAQNSGGAEEGEP